MPGPWEHSRQGKAKSVVRRNCWLETAGAGEDKRSCNIGSSCSSAHLSHDGRGLGECLQSSVESCGIKLHVGSVCG